MRTKPRKLKACDIPRFARIIKKAGLKDELATFAARAKDNENPEELGLKFFITLFESLSLDGVEQELFSFMASLAGCETEDVSEMELAELIELVKEIATESDIVGFFNSAFSTRLSKPATLSQSGTAASAS